MSQVFVGHLGVVLDRQVALVVASPFVDKAIQVCISPGPVAIPWLICAFASGMFAKSDPGVVVELVEAESHR